MSTKLTKFEDYRIDSLRKEIDAALKPIAEKYGLKGLHLGRITYGPAEFRTSMTVKIAAEDSAAVVKRMEQLSRAIGFAENILGREMYASDGLKYRVVDINTKKRKYPIVGQCVSNPDKQLLFTDTVRFIGEQPKTTLQETMERVRNNNTPIRTVTFINPNSNNNKP